MKKSSAERVAAGEGRDGGATGRDMRFNFSNERFSYGRIQFNILFPTYSHQKHFFSLFLRYFTAFDKEVVIHFPRERKKHHRAFLRDS